MNHLLYLAKDNTKWCNQIDFLKTYLRISPTVYVR